MRRTALIVAAMALLAAAGACSSGGRPVYLTVTSAAGEPVVAAHVRAMALDTNDVPLPVSMENLAKLERPLASGATDERGRVRLALRPEGNYLVEVNAPPFGSLSDEGPWRWVLLDEGDALRPVHSGVAAVELRTGRP